ncbi:MAG: ChrR family anti-sigma-E factor [Psychromonas sp.]|nr:ChrR family anti-sigma-E factor [Psychromonas sp.]
MIKFHPGGALLNEHIAGKLPLSLSVAVSAHIEMCEQCSAAAQKLELLQAQQLWQTTDDKAIDFGDMLHHILAKQPDSSFEFKDKSQLMAQVAEKSYQLPRAFQPFTQLKWSGFGSVNRARIITDENPVRASLLHIDKGGAIPKHQHKGYELTLLLAGSFTDENGTYHKGDLICLKGDDQHTPSSPSGCLCYVVQDAPIQFVEGVSKVLNPLTSFLY